MDGEQLEMGSLGCLMVSLNQCSTNDILTTMLLPFLRHFLCATAELKVFKRTSMNMTELQNLVDAAVAAAMAKRAIAPHIVPFARTPAQATKGILNYKTMEGMNIDFAAITALPTKYSGNSADMHMFLANLKERGRSYGWHNILNVPKGDNMLNLTDQHDILELADVKAHALVYENAQGRDAQNASQMFTFLYASLSEEAKRMVLSDCEDYSIVTTRGTISDRQRTNLSQDHYQE